jgi:hypothetical protein
VCEVVGRQRHHDPVAQQNANAKLAHPATKLGAHGISALELDRELTARVDLVDHAVDADVISPVFARGVEVPLSLPAAASSSASSHGSTTTVRSLLAPVRSIATSVATTTTTTTATAAATGALTGFVHSQGAAIEFRAVQLLDRLIRCAVVGESHEAETA